MENDQPKPTGEWTVFGTSVKRLGDDDSLFHCSTQTDADVAIRTHNAALDAEHAKTLKWTEESADLSRQLAAEREKLVLAVQAAQIANKQLAAEREKVKDAQDEAFAGKWTKDILDELSKRLPAGYHFGQLVADAHNAALAEAKDTAGIEGVKIGLAAEREKLAAAQSGNKAAKAFMDYLRANTGVSDEWPIELRVAEDSIDPINTLLNQFEQTIYATSTTALDAAIAEAQKPLMDALTRIRSESLSWTELQNIAAAALAKVKEGR